MREQTFDGTKRGAWLSVFVPLLLHVGPRVFVGAGPAYTRDLGGDDSFAAPLAAQTTIAGRVILGATIGGAPEPPTQAAPVGATEPVFGMRGQYVLTGEIGSAIYASTFEGTPSSIEGVSLSPGFDTFVAPNLSLGVGASLVTTSQTSASLSGNVDRQDASSIGVGPRIGFNAPIGRWQSFYPRFVLAGGYETIAASGSSGTRPVDYGGGFVTASIFAPYLLHPAPHAFFGLGPWVRRDFFRGVSSPGSGALSTALGASFIVGGWL